MTATNQVASKPLKCQTAELMYVLAEEEVCCSIHDKSRGPRTDPWGTQYARRESLSHL